MVAASILPVAIYKNELFFLFGKENEMEDSAKGFSDFGGRVEQGEQIFETAMREGAEELCGFLGDPTQLSELITQNGGHYPITYSSGNKAYHVHIFYMNYDEHLPHYFTNNHRFLWDRMEKNVLNDSKFFEKQEIRWFSSRDMKSNISEFRNFYKEIVSLLLKDLSKIKSFIKSKEKRPRKRSTFSRSKTRKLVKGG
jgi:8-oxo-dGTP pyrophosphatase MutT (NUDIX family)